MTVMTPHIEDGQCQGDASTDDKWNSKFVEERDIGEEFFHGEGGRIICIDLADHLLVLDGSHGVTIHLCPGGSLETKSVCVTTSEIRCWQIEPFLTSSVVITGRRMSEDSVSLLPRQNPQIKRIELYRLSTDVISFDVRLTDT